AGVAGKRGKADGRAVVGGDQRELAAKPRAELLLVIGCRRPRLALRVAVIVRGQFFDAGAKDFSEQRHVVRQKRPHGECFLLLRAGTHRAISQVVPSLVSLRTTPICFSSSRIRSDSAKFFALRAIVLASMS